MIGYTAGYILLQCAMMKIQPVTTRFATTTVKIARILPGTTATGMVNVMILLMIRKVLKNGLNVMKQPTLHVEPIIRSTMTATGTITTVKIHSGTIVTGMVRAATLFPMAIIPKSTFGAISKDTLMDILMVL